MTTRCMIISEELDFRDFKWNKNSLKAIRSLKIILKTKKTKLAKGSFLLWKILYVTLHKHVY